MIPGVDVDDPVDVTHKAVLVAVVGRGSGDAHDVHLVLIHQGVDQGLGVVFFLGREPEVGGNENSWQRHGDGLLAVPC